VNSQIDFSRTVLILKQSQVQEAGIIDWRCKPSQLGKASEHW